jgi:hypothetical protein
VMIKQLKLPKIDLMVELKGSEKVRENDYG